MNRRIYETQSLYVADILMNSINGLWIWTNAVMNSISDLFIWNIAYNRRHNAKINKRWSEKMGDIIFDTNSAGKIPTKVLIERNIDDIEKQRLNFTFDSTSHLGTETGSCITFFGKDRKGNTIELVIDVSVEELKKALERF